MELVFHGDVISNISFIADLHHLQTWQQITIDEYLQNTYF